MCKVIERKGNGFWSFNLNTWKYENKCNKGCSNCAQWYDCFYSCMNDETTDMFDCSQCSYKDECDKADEVATIIPFLKR